MRRPSRQMAAVTGALLLGVAGVWVLAERSRHRIVEAGFWFDGVTYGASESMIDRLGGPLEARDIDAIEAVAMAEIREAFTGLRISVSARRDATYRVRVVQELRDPRTRSRMGFAGESRAVSGFGGQGTLNFRLLASYAIGYAPPDAGRQEIVAAIGRGAGRAAVHEFTHQLLPTAPIHETRDIRSYEYRSADRREQYYGEGRWDTAWPLLVKRIGPVSTEELR